MLREDAPLLRRLRLERKTLELARQKIGPYTREGFRLADKITRLDSHIEQVEGREPESYWDAHKGSLLARPEAEAQAARFFPDSQGPLQIFDPERRCAKCGGRARTRWTEDRLLRTCKRCGFSYVELPLDSEKPSSPPEGELEGQG